MLPGPLPEAVVLPLPEAVMLPGPLPGSRLFQGLLLLHTQDRLLQEQHRHQCRQRHQHRHHLVQRPMSSGLGMGGSGGSGGRMVLARRMAAGTCGLRAWAGRRGRHGLAGAVGG